MRVDATPMLVPKASPHFDDFLGTGEDDVRFSWQSSDMSLKPTVHLSDEITNKCLGFCAGASDLAHILTAPSLGNCVHHENPVRDLLRGNSVAPHGRCQADN
jgi:hypothetical protein